MQYYLYAAREERSRNVKIGYSQDPRQTKRELQRGNPRNLYLNVLREYPTPEEAQAAEGAMHDVLDRRGLRIHPRTKREWFDADDADIQAALDAA